MKKSKFFQEYRAKGVPASEVPEEVVDPLIQQVMNAPQEQILSVGNEFKMEIDKKGETFASVVCARCGEMVVEKYARIIGDEKLCIPCQEKSL